MADANPLPPAQLCSDCAATANPNDPIDIFISAVCQTDKNLGVRSGIGIFFEFFSRHNGSESLPENRTQQQAELTVLRKALATAKNVHSEGIIRFNTDSYFILEVGTEWIPSATRPGTELTDEDYSKLEELGEEFRLLVAEAKSSNFSCQWHKVSRIEPNHQFSKAEELAEISVHGTSLTKFNFCCFG